MKQTNQRTAGRRSLASPVFSLILAGVLSAGTAFAGAPIEQDLLASYTATYAASMGGEDNAQVTIANTVAGNNAIQDQGGTGARMRVVGYYQSANDVTGQTTTGGIVSWLSSYNANLSDVVDRGTALGADLVVYICNNSDSASIAGVSQQPGMYSSLNPGAVWSAVFAHETGGHAYGRAHNDGVLNPKTIMLHNYCGGGAAPPYLYSNPNIWFNGVQLVGDPNNNCSMGALVNGGDNSSCSAQAVADRRARVVTAPALNNVIYHWMFTNAPGAAPASTTNYDLVVNAPAVVRGTGAVYTATALRIPGGTTGNVAMNAMSAYIDLPNGIISSQTNITIEIWATPRSALNWARICDFGRTDLSGDAGNGEWSGLPGTAAPGSTAAYDDLMLSADKGTDITQQRFESKLAGANVVTLDSALATVVGMQHHYAITFTDGLGTAGSNGGRWQWFRDGDAVAYLDVTNHLSAIHDVDNWLGRSLYSGDSNGNSDYAEVRISNVALGRNQILANYLLGPNYIPTANVVLTNSDATSASSFAGAGQWSNGAVPSAGNDYETYDFLLGTPANGSSYAFAGNSLKLSGGSLLWQGTSSSTITVNNLVLNGATVRHSGSGTCTLAGNANVTTNGATFNAVNGAETISANLSGSGPLTCLANAVTLSGNNSAFSGKTSIGDGMAGTLVIDSQARLGTAPTNFTADQLDLNRGTLQTTASVAISDTNRGVMIDVSGGTFNVASGTTLTLSSTLSSPATAANIVVGSLTKAGQGTLVLNSPSNTFRGTLYVDTASTSANDGAVTLSNNQVLANAHSPIYIRNNNSGSSRLQLNGASGSITLPQMISLNARTTSTIAIENLAGTNMVAGGLALNVGGSVYLVQSDANSLLNLGGSIYNATTSARTLTLQGTGNHLVSGTILDSGAPMNLAKSGTGTAILAANNSYSGTTAVNQGTLKLQSPGALLHLTFDNPIGSSNGSVITNTGAGGPVYNGSIIGSGASIVGGKFGNALNLNGTGTTSASNIVYIPSKVLSTDAGGSWTVAFWVKTTTAGAVIMYQGDGSWSSSGQTTYYLNAGSATTTGATKAGLVRWGGGWLTGSTALNNGAWHHVALVDNAGTESIFVDGNVDTVVSTNSGALASGANQLWIGGSPDPGDGTVKMTGQIDELYLFNRALSRTEVVGLVNNNNPNSTNVPVLPVTTPVSVAAGATLDLGGMGQTIQSLSGAGTVTNTASGPATLILSNSAGSVTFSGAISDAATNAVSLVQIGSVTNILSGLNNYHGTTAINGGALFVNGSLGSGLTTVASGALLGGIGTVGGDLTVQSGATLSPGNGVGTLTANGTVTLQAGSTTVLEINKSAPANDRLIAGGAVNYGGTLVVTNLAGTLAGGDAFQLFQASAYNGAFTAFSLPPLSAGLVWNTNALSSGLLTVVQTAPTNLVFAVGSAGGASLNFSWPSDRIGWRLLVQTNHFTHGISLDTNDWTTVPGSPQTNQVILPIDPSLPLEFYRLIYP